MPLFQYIYLLSMKVNWQCLKNLAQLLALLDFVCLGPSLPVLFRVDPSKINHCHVFLGWVTSAPSTVICWGWRTCFYHRAASIIRQLLTLGCGMGLISQKCWQKKMKVLTFDYFAYYRFFCLQTSTWLVFSSNYSILNTSMQIWNTACRSQRHDRTRRYRNG